MGSARVRPYPTPDLISQKSIFRKKASFENLKVQKKQKGSVGLPQPRLYEAGVSIVFKRAPLLCWISYSYPSNEECCSNISEWRARTSV
jgi:hypothetical protein